MKNRFKTFLLRWVLVTLILWVMVSIGFMAIGGSINPLEWKDVHRMNFGSWLILFGALSAIFSAISTSEL